MAKLFKITETLLLLTLLATSVAAQDVRYKIEHLTEQDGLSHACISCMIQDSKGFMWFGTEGGLNKYDGYTIQEYVHHPDDPFSLTHNFIRTFYEDPEDSGTVLWIGTKGGGLNKYDRATDRFISYQHDPYDSTSLSHNEVKCIFKDSEGRYWIGTEGGGLNTFDRETGKFVWYKNNPNDPQSLSSDYVFSISEDHQGYLWIGGGGLDRFDCKTQQFRHYRYDPNEPETLPSHVVFAVHVDRTGELWIGTRSGLRKYDAQTDRVIRHKFKTGYSNILDHALIYSIFEDSRGGLWIATHGNGLYYISPERDKFVNYQYASGNPNSLGGDNISSIYQDQSGIIWVGTYCSGITKMLPIQKEFKHYQHLPGDSTSLSHNSVLSIYEDGVGNLWVGTDGGGLNKFNRENGTFTHYQFDAYNNVLDICGAKSGELWMATRINLTRFNPHTERFVSYPGKFLGYHPKVLALVNEMRKQKAALAAIQHVGNDKNIVRTFEISQRTPVLIVALGEGDANGLVDAGSLAGYGTEEHLWEMQFEKTKHAGGAFRNRIQLTVMVLNPGKYQLHYRSNAEHSYGGWKNSAPDNAELWGVAIFPVSPEGARRIHALAETEYFSSSIGEGGEVVNVYEDRSGVTWCVLRGNGPFQFDRHKKQFSPYEVVTSESISEKISLVYQDRDGTLWFGTFGKGLVKRMTASFRRTGQEKYEYVQYQSDSENPSSMSSNKINSICEDHKGFLWIGTDNGLNKFDKEAETFIRYSDKDGLPSNSIYGILEDNNGHLWICTNRGLSNFNPKTQVFKNYTVSDGLPSNVLTSSVLCKSESGEIFLGGNGLNVFHPDSLSDNPHIPPVVITDFQLFNRSVFPGNDSPLRKSILETKAIDLSHEQNVISFAFAALDFINPSRNKYAYQMEGVDRDWVYTDSSRRFATYTQLGPGEYTFHVKGSNNDGIWNEEGVSVRIIITPPWWKTWWAYLFYLIVVTAILYTLRRYDLHRQRLKHRLQLEHVHAEKLEELDRVKSHFFGNISHEFRTPLTLILGPLEKLISETRQRDLKQQYQVMLRSGWRLLNLINQLLDLSKLEFGSMTLRASCQDIVSLLKTMTETFISAAERKKITLTLHSAQATIMAYIDQDKLEKIVSNLLANAIKFTPEGGSIDVEVRALEDDGPMGRSAEWASSRGARVAGREWVQVTITDTGIGIADDKIGRIFDRFYQADSAQTHAQGGTGIGLALARELVDLHHGEISVESSPGVGTTFIVRLPLGRAHLAPEEVLETPLPGKDVLDYVRHPSVAEEAADLTTSEASQAIAPKGKPPLLLLVEDHADLRAYLRSFLAPLYRILEARDGEQGLASAIENIPDLVVSDVMMPGMDGFALCARLRADERTSHIPIVLLTARASTESRIEGLEIGADDYVIKPFDARELQVRVRNLIEQRRKLRERIRRELSVHPGPLQVVPTEEKFLRRAISIVEQHLSEENFSVVQFSREVGISRVQLHRKLRALTDHSTSEFIRTLRLNRAAQLLAQHSGNVTEVAYTVGFNNLSYFAKCFHRQFGISPSAYATRPTHFRSNREDDANKM